MSAAASLSDEAVEAEVDALYRLAPDAFVAARNALAARLKAAGRREDSARVKGLARPATSAWAVNQIYWQARNFLERLLDAGEALRAAQESGGEALRDAMRDRRDALGTARDRALGFLREAGHAATPALDQRLSSTLLALATYARRPPAGVVVGRLVADLEPPGFEALAGLTLPEPLLAAAAAVVAPGAASPVARAAPQADETERVARERVEREREEERRREAERAAESARRLARRDAAQARARETRVLAAAALARLSEARAELARAECDAAHADAVAAQAQADLERAQGDLLA